MRTLMPVMLTMGLALLLAGCINIITEERTIEYHYHGPEAEAWATDGHLAPGVYYHDCDVENCPMGGYFDDDDDDDEDDDD